MNPETNTVDNEPNESAAQENAGAASPEVDRLRAERDELRDLLLRRQAEFDNFRKRTERERSEYLQWAGMETVKDLLPVLDDFERALKVEGGGSDYAKGVEMINTRMLETLKKLGLEPIEAAGKAFDPHQHQAIERVESSSVPDNTVLGEFQRGYNFKGKMLRPSMVKVSVKP